MRTMIFFDQIQSGHGGKDKVNVPLDVTKGGIGSALTFAEYMKDENLKLIATMFSGSQYYFDNEEKSKKQITNLIKKLKVKLVICGPTYDYHNYAKMALNLADHINKNTECVAIVCCAEKNNKELIEKYKIDNIIVKMPKKGGVGLNKSLQNMVKIGRTAVEGSIDEKMKNQIY